MATDTQFRRRVAEVQDTTRIADAVLKSPFNTGGNEIRVPLYNDAVPSTDLDTLKLEATKLTGVPIAREKEGDSTILVFPAGSVRHLSSQPLAFASRAAQPEISGPAVAKATGEMAKPTETTPSAAEPGPRVRRAYTRRVKPAADAPPGDDPAAPAEAKESDITRRTTPLPPRGATPEIPPALAAIINEIAEAAKNPDRKDVKMFGYSPSLTIDRMGDVGNRVLENEDGLKKLGLGLNVYANTIQMSKSRVMALATGPEAAVVR